MYDITMIQSLGIFNKEEGREYVFHSLRYDFQMPSVPNIGLTFYGEDAGVIIFTVSEVSYNLDTKRYEIFEEFGPCLNEETCNEIADRLIACGWKPTKD